MSLFFRFDLQAMLSAAQKPVRAVKIDNVSLRHQLDVCQTTQRVERVRFLEEGVPCAVDELKRLHDEFDFPDPPATEFDIASKPAGADDVTFNPRFDLCDLTQHIGRRALWIDERLEPVQKFVGQFAAAGHAARLDERESLPCFAKTAVVMLHAFERAS